MEDQPPIGLVRILVDVIDPMGVEYVPLANDEPCCRVAALLRQLPDRVARAHGS